MDDFNATRRRFLTRHTLGVGGLALAWMLQRDGLLATPPDVPRTPRSFDLKPRRTHFPPRAKAMISLFMNGGPSHVDLFDPKPELTRHDGQEYQGDIKFSFVNRATKKLMASPWKFHKRGQSGIEVSELLPHIAGVIDDLCVVRSMSTGMNSHEPNIWYLNTGKAEPKRPALGSWLTYGLGSENQDLPAFVVMTDPGGLPVVGVDNWSSGWLPPIYQGTVLRPREPRILNLDPPSHLRGEPQRQNLAFLNQLNRDHLVRHPGERDLEARIASYELAARMQSAAKEAVDISAESEATKELYGLNQDETREYGSRCLIARRLVERGVRFIQIYLAGQPWDNHEDIRTGLAAICRKTDRPSAALITDLKARGLLDSTLVHWGGEIGRLPVVEGSPEKAGRDHNGQGFTTLLAGGGVKGGIAYGETDEVGHHAAVNPVSPHDYQATLLHLFGLDPVDLTYHHSGQERKLIDGGDAGRIVREILA